MEARHPVKDIVLPLAVVVGLVGNAWWGGVGWGKVSHQLDTLTDQISQMSKRTDDVARDVTDLKAWRIAKEKDDADRDRNFKLLRMYTKGRIARLPYHTSDDGE